MSRDGFVSWEGFRYGVHRKWVDATVQVGQLQSAVEFDGLASRREGSRSLLTLE